MKLIEIYIKDNLVKEMERLVNIIRHTDFINKAEILYLYEEYKYKKYKKKKIGWKQPHTRKVKLPLIQAANLGNIEAI